MSSRTATTQPSDPGGTSCSDRTRATQVTTLTAISIRATTRETLLPLIRTRTEQAHTIERSTMKRRNVQMAFVGEGVNANDDQAIDQMVDGDEAVDVDVRGGKLMVVVPAGTPDDQIF